MQHVYKYIDEYNPKNRCKIFLVLDDMISDMVSNKKLHMIVTELFTKGTKLNISFVFITQSCYKVP